MTKISEVQKEQVKNMREDGKTYQEIRDFFRESYEIKLFDCDIAAIMREKGQSRKINKPSVRKQAKPAPVPEVKEQSDEFSAHIHAAYDIFKKEFLRRVEEVLFV